MFSNFKIIHEIIFCITNDEIKISFIDVILHYRSVKRRHAIDQYEKRTLRARNRSTLDKTTVLATANKCSKALKAHVPVRSYLMKGNNQKWSVP
jgi:hypothetical protein